MWPVRHGAVLNNSGEWGLTLNFQYCKQFRAKESSQALAVKAELPQKSWEQQPQPVRSDDPAKHKMVTRRDCILLWFFSALTTTLETLTSCWYPKGEIHFLYMLQCLRDPPAWVSLIIWLLAQTLCAAWSLQEHSPANWYIPTVTILFARKKKLFQIRAKTEKWSKIKFQIGKRKESMYF